MCTHRIGVLLWCLLGNALAPATGFAAMPTDSLFAGNAGAGMAMLRAALDRRPDDFAAALRLGHAYLDAHDYKMARRTFRRAMALAPENPAPYYGQGLVHMALPTERYLAISYFRKALMRDRTFVEARYQIARARFLMKELDTQAEIEKVLAIDPEYADAYGLMGDWFSSVEEFGRAVIWYTRYLALRPDDEEARRKLGVAYLRVRDYDRVQETLLNDVQEHPRAVALMPVVAQACLKQNRMDVAMRFFQAYLAAIDPEERAMYEDIRHVASQEERSAYAQTPAAERAEFLSRFWTGRDPDLSTPVNERLLEHYRRVWYARTMFSESKQPFDRRGEVYIRFGEPDHRMRSREMNLSQDLAVHRVRERLAVDLYGTAAMGETFVGPVFPVRNFALTRDALGFETSDPFSIDAGVVVDEGLAPAQFVLEEDRSQEERDNDRTPGGEARAEDDAQAVPARRRQPIAPEFERRPFVFAETDEPDPFSLSGARPVTGGENLGSVAWEAWIYTRIDGGIEIAFTDEFGSGAFDFAPVPAGPEVAVNQVARLERFSPRRAFERAAQVSSDVYTPTMGTPIFDFYFSTADFRGAAGESALEVYFGLPCAPAHYSAESDAIRMRVVRQAALVPVAADTVYRRGGEMVYTAPGTQMAPGAVVPDVVRLDVPPGRYRLEVKAQDRRTGQVGLYRQMVDVGAYGSEDLQVSGLEMAWRVADVRPADVSGADGPFAKGGVEVIPMPSRTYRRGQNAFVYYEIYNLTRDAFGQTHYQVVYTIEADGGGVLSRLAQTLKGRRVEKVAVGYEGRGETDSEGAYTELDLRATRPGRHVLQVAVTDLNSGATAVRKTLFVVAE